MIAPTRAEHLSDHCVRNVWSCEACEYQFEDTIYIYARELADADWALRNKLRQLRHVGSDPTRLILAE
jgi:hypothetical protein